MSLRDRMKAAVAAIVAAVTYGIGAAQDEVLSFDEIGVGAGLILSALVAFGAVFYVRNKPPAA